ncbi:MAG: tRNA pseudouridine(38-40) synthase TruA [Coriobacteriales bacterium]|nr:tRNA pseudouridine(38-40) synthase TruA [Coriobacteriales bacterium]
MSTFALKIAYLGSNFSGFARQPRQRSVQGELEQSLTRLLDQPIVLACAGRTDAGVHALGQIISFVVKPEMLTHSARLLQPSLLQRALNADLPKDIFCRGAKLAPEAFSARFDARARTYRYLICQERPLFIHAWWLRRHPLDLAAMREAAALLIGEHDFKSFCVAKSAAALEARGLSTCRELIQLKLFRRSVLGQPCLVVEVTGNAFLHSMVRTMVGTLVKVGLGQRDPSWVAEVLAARSRAAAGDSAPADGLYLWSVDYDYCHGALCCRIRPEAAFSQGPRVAPARGL